MLANLINEINTSFWGFSDNAFNNNLFTAVNLLQLNNIDIRNEDYNEARRQAKTITYYSDAANEITSEQLESAENLVAVINVSGTITKEDQFCGPVGVATLTKMIKDADRNDKVKSIVLKINSGGGSGNAAQDLANYIKTVEKPIIAFVDDYAASAAYWIASACDYIYAKALTTQVGSIGAFISFADYTEYYKLNGINIIEVYAKQSVDKNKPYYDAINGNTDLLANEITYFNSFFIASVKESRGIEVKKKMENPFTGKMYFAEDAEKIGLIDEIADFDTAIKEIINY